MDQTSFASVLVGYENPELFEEALDRYAAFSHCGAMAQKALQSDVVVLGLFRSNLNEDQKAIIESLLLTKRVVALLGDLDVYTSIPNIVHADAIIHMTIETPLHADVISQQLFGGASIQAVQIKDSNGNVLNDEMETSEKLIRLGFAPSQVVGFAPGMESRIDMIIKEAIDSMAFPGCQVLVAKKGNVVFHKTYGHHTYDKKIPVAPTDIYDLASITKIAAATTSLMKLNGDGLFDLDAPLKTYFPEVNGSDKADLIMRQILAHNARLKAWIPYWTTTIKKNGKYKRKTLKKKFKKKYPIKLTDNLYLYRDYKSQIYQMIKDSPMNVDPGYLYSGLSFYLYPEIVERLSGMDFEEFLKSNIYRKLGAETITFNPSRFYPLERIIPTERDTFFRKIQLHGVVHDEGAAMMNGVSGNAGLFASTQDLAKLMQMFLNGGKYGGEQLLKKEVVEEFTRCQYCDEGNRRGLGFEKPMIEFDPERSHVSKYVSKASFGHSGYTGTFAWADPENEVIFIFMSNRVYPTRLNRKLYTMNIRPRIQDVIYESIRY